MVTKKRRSPVSTTVPKTAIEQATLTLQELPEKTRDFWSLREAIEHLQDSIKAALDKGYSHDEVAAMLTERGVEINAASLKYHLNAARRRNNPAEPRAKRPHKVRKTSTAAKLGSATEAIASDLSRSKAESTEEKGIAGVISYLMNEPQKSDNTPADAAQTNGAIPDAALTKKRTGRAASKTKATEEAKPAAKIRAAAKTKSSTRSTSTKASAQSDSPRGRKKKETP